MARYKYVNGKRIELSPAEVLAREAEEADEATNGATRRLADRKSALRQALQDSDLHKPVLEALFDMENRLRTLEARSPVTRVQFINFFENQLS